MWLALVLCHLAALAAAVAFLRHYILLAQYPWWFSVPLVAALYMPLQITFLLPIDHVSHNSQPPWLALLDQALRRLWKANYWTTFVLTWFLLPVLQDYHRLGHHRPLDKLRDSLRQNAKFRLLMLAACVGAAVYLMLGAGLSVANLRLMVIALSHIYALVLALWLMAHGLFAVPRGRWAEGSLVGHLNGLYLRVPKLVDLLEDTRMAFRDELLQVLVLERDYTQAEDLRFRDWILDLARKVPDELRESLARQYLGDGEIARSQVTEPFVAALAALFHAHLHELAALEAEYSLLLAKVEKLTSYLDAAASPAERRQIVAQADPGWNPAVAYFVHRHYLPWSARAAACAMYAASLVVLQLEFFHLTRFSLIDVLVTRTALSLPAAQAAVQAFFFAYMVACSLVSLARLRVFNMYHLVPRHSDPASACFFVSYMARLTIPLSYNFITLFRSRASAFEDWYGKLIKLTGLPNLMNNWIPRLLLIPIVLTAFNVYDKLKKKLGLQLDFYGVWGNFDDDDQELNLSTRKDLLIVEAKRIVGLELAKRNRRRPEQALHELQSQEASSLWTTLNGAVSGIRNAVQRWRPLYRDDPLEYNYDEDNETLVL